MAIEPTLEPGLNTTELDRSEESSTASLYRAAIGPIGTSFYLPIFNRFEAADRGGLSWNWAASLNTLNWLAFRKLWSAALAYAGAAVGLALLIFGIGRLVFRFSEPVEWVLLAGYAAVMFVVPGLFANALLHADCRKRMARALSANTTLPEACSMLSRQASSRNRMIVIAAANIVVLGLLTGAYLKLPAAGSLPSDTMAALAKVDPLGTKTSAAAAGPVTPASAPASAAQAASPVAPAASAPAVKTSEPVQVPVSVAAASAPVATAVAKPASSPVSAPPIQPVTVVATPPSKTPAAAASASRVASGAVKSEAPRKTAQAPARAASQANGPVTASPQDAGKVYRSEPTPPAAKPAVAAAVKQQTGVAGKPSGAASKPAITASAAKAAISTAKGGGLFQINVGLFAQDMNATNALAKLKDAGLPAYSDEIKGAKGKLTRVRVGPFTTQADAESAIAKIKALGLDALLVRP